MTTDVAWTPCEATDLPLGVKTEADDSYPDLDPSHQEGVGPIPQELEADVSFFNDHSIPIWNPTELTPEVSSIPMLDVTGYNFDDCTVLQQLQSYSGVSHEQAWTHFYRSVEAGRSLFS